MRSRRPIWFSLLAVPMAFSACAPRAITPQQATVALGEMVREHPDAFHMASVTIKTDWFRVDEADNSYRISIRSGACIFDYKGRFTFRDGRWSASEPSLTSSAKVAR